MHMRHTIVGAVAALALATSAGAQSVTVGTENTNNCVPFGCPFAPTRYQQVYSASAFSGPLTIDSLVFAVAQTQSPGWTRPATYEISFGLTAAAPGGLAADFQTNESSPEQVFGTFVDGGTAVTSYLSLVGATPFFYDPSLGNLLMDVRVSNLGYDDAPNFANLAADDSGQLTSRVYGDGTTGVVDNYGLVTGFNGYAATTAPEPASFVLLGTGIVGLVPIARRKLRRL